MLYISTSIISDVKHGFWSRNGGCSIGHFGSMNLALTKGDLIENVKQNREIVASTVNSNILTAEQVHGNEVAIVQQPWCFLDKQTPKVDAIISQIPGQAIGVITADCVPILVHDPVSKTIAAIHAGWRGALSGVVANTIKATQSLGSNVENIQCAIGPCIQQNNYEVSDQIFTDFAKTDPDYKQYFKSNGNKYMLNLPGIIEYQLQQLGVKQIENTNICTYANPDQYFSCRRATHKKEPTFGCQISFIALNKSE